MGGTKIERSNSIAQSIELEAEITSNIPLKEVRLELVSGGDTKTKPITLGKDEFTKSVKQKITLQDGENIIRLIAVNNKGGEVAVCAPY